ncbi:MAG TPA: helix-turn-helix domain-containing protein [Pseudonocardia sp.]|nr:helix-turn-helix domain-containing protein [Pseudonocardia sp.]
MVQTVREAWPRLSPRCSELFREGARIALSPRAEWVQELHDGVLSGEHVRPIAEDPVLAEGIRRTNLANLLQWASANVQRPGQRVPPALVPDALATARDLVRRGLDTAALDSYRTGQSVAWRYWMEICFQLTSDPVELRELLEASSLSISTFIDDTIAAISARMDAERADLTGGTHAQRRATIALLLEGAPITAARAEAQLGYRFAGTHTALIVWSGTGQDATSDELESAAEAVMKAAGADRRLTVVASAAALWLWLPVAAPTTAQLAPVMARHPLVRVAVGRTGTELEGFRRSHLDAGVAQQMLADHTSHLNQRRQIASFSDVQLVALLTRDATRAEEFLGDTLGALGAEDPAEAELRDVVLAYIREQCNASRAAERLYTHRNTVLRRLARADELLPRPLADNVIHVGAALELLAWRNGRA